MNTRTSRITEAEAHQELILMDSRVAGIIDESYFDRFRRMDLPYSGLLTRFRDILSETRWCGGHLIHLGKIVGNEILEFMESDPDVPAGMLLESALKALGRSIPFLATSLAPMAAEVQCQGFSRVVSAGGYTEKLDDRALVFFKRFAEVLNVNQNLLHDQEDKDVPAVTFEEPALFELDEAENPFDLDDLSNLSPAATATAKFLIKLGVADGHFSDPEKQLICQAVEHMEESLTPYQYERLISEASHESLEDILKNVSQESVVFRERLLLLAMLLSAADGRVDAIEKKLLAQSLPFLNLSKQRYSEIARDALALIKARRHPLGESTKATPHEIPNQTSAPRDLSPAPCDRSVEHAQIARSTLELTAETPAAIPELDRLNDRPTVPPREVPHVPERPPPQAAPVRSAAPERHPAPPTPERKIWRCPACTMPQFAEFDECPQCGVIVSKFRQKLARRWEDSEEDHIIEVPSEPVEDNRREADSSPSSRMETDASSRCSGCRAALPPGVKFCPSCGTRAV